MLTLLLVACSTHAPSSAPTPTPTPSSVVDDAPDARFVTRTLDNGVQLTVLPNDHPKHRAVYLLLVEAGFEHETPDAAGAAHFVEHMAFNGTRSFPGETLVPWLESRGVPFGHGTNAHTSSRHTWYTLQVDTRTDEVMAKIPDMFRDVVDGITFDPAAVEAERNILVAEMEMRTGSGEVEHPGGGPDDYRAIPAQALVDFHDTWYRSDRVQALVVGDIDPQPTLDRLAATLGDLPAPTEPAPPGPPPEPEGPERDLKNGFPATVDPVLAEFGMGSFDISMVWLGTTDDAAGASLIAEVLTERLRSLSGGRAGVDGTHVSTLAKTDAGTLLDAMALSVPPTSDEIERARTTLLLRWVERPFAHTPVSTDTWVSYTLRSLLEEGRLPSDPIAEGRHQREAVLERSDDQLASLWTEITDFDELGMFLTTPELTEAGPLPEAMVARLRERAVAPATLRDPSRPTVPEMTPGAVEPLPVDLEGLHAWKTAWGAQLLLRPDDQLPAVWIEVRVPYVTEPLLDRSRSMSALGGASEALERDLESHPAISVADLSYGDGHLSVRAQVMPAQVDAFLRMLLARVHQLQGGGALLQLQRTTIVATGPLGPTEAQQALARVAGLTPEVVPHPPLPAPKPGSGPVTTDPNFVSMYWTRRPATLEEQEQLPYLAATLEESVRLFVREELGLAYKYGTELTLAEDQSQVKVDVTPRAGEHEAIATELEAIRARLVEAPLDEATWKRVVMVTAGVDPSDPDPVRWLDAMAGRLTVLDSVVEAATRPATPAPSPTELHALAQLWLNEPWSLD